MEGVVWREAASPGQVLEELDAADDKTHPTWVPQARGREARESDARIARRTEPREANLREVGREQCDFSRLQRLSGFSPTTVGGATTPAQGASLGGAMFQQAAPTSQLHEENGAVDKGHRCSRATQARRCNGGAGGIFGTRRRGEGAEVGLGKTREITRVVGQLRPSTPL